MAANSTDINVKKADPVPSFESILKVLGREQNQLMIVAITANTTVHSLWLVMVLRYLALTFQMSQCCFTGKRPEIMVIPVRANLG